MQHCVRWRRGRSAAAPIFAAAGAYKTGHPATDIGACGRKGPRRHGWSGGTRHAWVQSGEPAALFFCSVFSFWHNRTDHAQLACVRSPSPCAPQGETTVATATPLPPRHYSSSRSETSFKIPSALCESASRLALLYSRWSASSEVLRPAAAAN